MNRDMYDPEYKREAEVEYLEAAGWIWNGGTNWRHPKTRAIHSHIDAVDMQKRYLDEPKEGAIV